MISWDLEVLIAVTLKKLSALAFVIIGVVKDSGGQPWLSGALVDVAKDYRPQCFSLK